MGLYGDTIIAAGEYPVCEGPIEVRGYNPLPAFSSMPAGTVIRDLSTGLLMLNTGAAWVAISGANTGVTPGGYGDGTHVVTLTVDAQGRITTCAAVAITGLPESAVTGLVSDLAAKAADSAVVHNTGNETVNGTKTFGSTIVAPGVTAASGSLALGSSTIPTSTGGGEAHHRRQISVNTALTANDYAVELAAAGIVVTLPAAPASGTQIIIKDVTGLPSPGHSIVGAQTIDGTATTYLDVPYGSYILQYDSTSSVWRSIAQPYHRPNVPYVLWFPGNTSSQNIACGKFYQVNKPLPVIWSWEFWVCPQDAGSSYAIIESATGFHCLMAGFAQSGAGSVNTPFGFIGNVLGGGGSIELGGDDGLFNGEWGHYLQCCDGSFLYVFINGILQGQVAWTGTRSTFNTDANSTGTITIGGTDHNGLSGKLGGYIRGWEGHNPVGLRGSPLSAFFPERFPSNNSWDIVKRFTPPNFLMDLGSRQGSIITDVSPIGFNGFGPLATPGAPTIGNVNTAGITTYTYKWVDLAGAFSTEGSAAGTTTTGNATLGNTNYNTVTRSGTQPLATASQIYRTVGGGSTGLIGTVGPGVTVFNDTGIAAVNVEVPPSNLSSAGRTHPGSFRGALAGGTNVGADDDGFPNAAVTSYPTPTWIQDPTAPFSKTVVPVAQTGYTPVPSAIPVNARIFDDFERADQTFAIQQAPNLGSTVAGASLGSLAYTQGQYPGGSGNPALWGIMHGYARFLDTREAWATVDNLQADADVQVDRFIGTYNNVAHSQTGLIFHMTDANNFMFVSVQGALASAVVRVGAFVAGASTLVTGHGGFWDTSAPANTTWTRIRIVTSGNNITVYTGVKTGAHDANGFPTYTWTQLTTGTTAQNNTGTQVGISQYNTAHGAAVSSLARWNNFSVV